MPYQLSIYELIGEQEPQGMSQIHLAHAPQFLPRKPSLLNDIESKLYRIISRTFPDALNLRQIRARANYRTNPYPRYSKKEISKTIEKLVRDKWIIQIPRSYEEALGKEIVYLLR